MDEEKPKKRVGRKAKLPVSEMITEKNGVGGAREGAGRKRAFARIDVWEQLQALNYNPLVELVKKASDPACPEKIKVAIDTELLGYCAPKLKSVEHKAEEGSPMEDLMKIVAQQGRPKPNGDK